MIHISWFCNRHKVEIFLKNSWNCEVRLNLFTKSCLTNNYLSRDPHFKILAWVECWNIFEKLMKLWNPSEFFHKTMSHEQLLFTWSTFRDSSMSAKLKCFWKAHRDMFLWKNSGGLHTKMSFSKIFQLCTRVRRLPAHVTLVSCSMTLGGVLHDRNVVGLVET